MQLGPPWVRKEEKKKDRRRDGERKRRRFSSICLYKHTIPGTHFQAQTDGLMNVNTQKCTWTHTHTHTFFVTALVCPLAALKLEVLTPTCPGTGVKMLMLMLMAGTYSRRCSDPSLAMSEPHNGGRSEVKEGRGACSLNHRRWWGKKKKKKKKTGGLLCSLPKGVGFSGGYLLELLPKLVGSPWNTLAAEGRVGGLLPENLPGIKTHPAPPRLLRCRRMKVEGERNE